MKLITYAIVIYTGSGTPVKRASYTGKAPPSAELNAPGATPSKRLAAFGGTNSMGVAGTKSLLIPQPSSEGP